MAERPADPGCSFESVAFVWLEIRQHEPG